MCMYVCMCVCESECVCSTHTHCVLYNNTTMDIRYIYT